MKQLNQKTPWVFRLGVALLCVMLMTTHFTGNLYARYSTTATGSDSARVAKFDVTAEIVENDDGTYTLSIQNNSEVTVSYVVVGVVVGTPDLPNGVSILWADGDSNATLAPNSSAERVFYFEEEYQDYHNELEINLTVKVEQVD